MTLDDRTHRKFELTTWGLLFIWWGLRWWPLIVLPNGSGLLGTGLIMLGLNAARSRKGIPTRSTTTRLGLLALVLGGLLLLTTEIFHLSVEVPLFESSLIVLGVIILINALRSQQNAADA